LGLAVHGDPAFPAEFKVLAAVAIGAVTVVNSASEDNLMPKFMTESTDRIPR
jgi:hypothetical protein